MGAHERKQMAAWVALPAAAIINGGLRDATYGRALTRTASHSLAVLPLSAAIVGWACALARRRPLPDERAGGRVGLVWLALTLGFEFGLGSARKVPLAEMLGDYDVRRGNLWPVVPVVTAMAPAIAGRRAVRQGTIA